MGRTFAVRGSRECGLVHQKRVREQARQFEGNPELLIRRKVQLEAKQRA